MADYGRDAIFETRMQVRFPLSNPGVVQEGQPASLTLTSGDGQPVSSEAVPVKEWSIVDDVMTISDVCTFSVANIDGENVDRFPMGTLVIIEESHPQVAGGKWVKHFTGRVTATETFTDNSGGSNIMVTCMDMGWHLLNCHAKPLKSIRNARLAKKSDAKGSKDKTLLEILIDPSWGFDLTQVKADGNAMARLKHGRQVIIQNLQRVEGQILPYIQSEPGQAPYEIIRMYAEREGLLVNVDRDGNLVFFRPDYNKDPIFELYNYPSNDINSRLNNTIGRPSVRSTIDGIYSETTCFSTVVIDDQINTDNPNAAYRKNTFTPSYNSLPFNRSFVFSDSEAINQTLRLNRAKWRYQLGIFDSWEYTAEFAGHVQGPQENSGFWTANELISVKDPINGIDGKHYISRVQRSSTNSGGNRTTITIKKCGLLDPTLGSLSTPGQKKKVGGGVKTPVNTPVSENASGFAPVYDANGNQIGWKKP